MHNIFTIVFHYYGDGATPGKLLCEWPFSIAKSSAIIYMAWRRAAQRVSDDIAPRPSACRAHGVYSMMTPNRRPYDGIAAAPKPRTNGLSAAMALGAGAMFISTSLLAGKSIALSSAERIAARSNIMISTPVIKKLIKVYYLTTRMHEFQRRPFSGQTFRRASRLFSLTLANA